MSEDKRPVGRPTKYKPEYCDMIIEHMADGASMTSFAAEIDVARSSLNEWVNEHPEFSDAVTRAKAKCSAWWERVARTNAVTGNGNATLVVFGLKNMSPDDWRDKQEVEHAGKNGGPMEVVHMKPTDIKRVMEADDC